MSIVDDQVEETKTTKINLEDLSFRNRIALIEKLPERVTKEVLDYISSLKTEMGKVTLVEVDVGTKKTPKMVKENITVVLRNTRCC